MYHSILVPLDGSPFAEHALPLALAIARRAGASLQLALVHRLGSGGFAEGGAYFIDDTLDAQLKQRDRDYLDGVVNRLAAQVHVKPVLLEGQVVDALRAHITGSKTDLVVMTTHGRGPLGRFWLGSVADELVRRSPVPILLVRPHEEPDLTREPAVPHILVPLDGTPLAEQILAPAAALGSLLDADFTLLRVVEPVPPLPHLPDGTVAGKAALAMTGRLQGIQAQLHLEAEDYLDSVAERLRQQLLHVRTKVVFEERPAVAILHEAEHLGSGLVALETHGRRGLARLFLGSVADKVLRASPLPLLLHRPNGM